MTAAPTHAHRHTLFSPELPNKCVHALRKFPTMSPHLLSENQEVITREIWHYKRTLTGDSFQHTFQSPVGRACFTGTCQQRGLTVSAMKTPQEAQQSHSSEPWRYLDVSPWRLPPTSGSQLGRLCFLPGLGADHPF